mmetsp:Transcript_29980/g.54305  ORF Transcript_29980/g.54305 Transcript_29980/m.54305 type:complete len:384 (+) Transcript_29980:66-1217(+)|eukprot:CAMPEP_0197622466 /NCGR_PEP_ID=MMETSP1338-20131121/2764_1 /TAXON_ID=43686 ORGANISM="Pelagodinium beii, Strain RCC1491" /NCGR_SAMPLE_ID=MMETSP1338 /ASSEMBLY_ACC=CAM_ASM_000754 /LENGTH=383 /DNA_ID=CAMNT_0043192199 /DNA_START=66 /DNA_END=1217 /DNA_ORIENTATION=+
MVRLLLLAACVLGQVDAAAFTSFSVTPKLSGVTAVDTDVPDEISIAIEVATGLTTDNDNLVITITGGGSSLLDNDATFTVAGVTGATAAYVQSTRILTITFASAASTGPLPASLTTLTLTSPAGGGVFQAVDTTAYNFAGATNSGGGVTPEDSGSATFTASSGGGASGDPITFWNGQKTKFWLPMKSKVPLLETPHFILWATALQGPTEDLQWFQSFMVTLPNHQPVAQVDLDHTGQRQLDVMVGQGKGMTALRRGGVQLLSSSLRFALSDVKLQNNRAKGAKKTEYFFVEAPEVSFAIFSSYAGTEFPNDEQLQQKYQHLNFLPMDIADSSNFKGALPQIWGLVPMEADTAAMLVPPSKAREVAAEPDSCCPGAVKACMEAM